VRAVLDSIHKDDNHYHDNHYPKDCKSVRFFRSADGTASLSLHKFFQLPSVLGPVQELNMMLSYTLVCTICV